MRNLQAKLFNKKASILKNKPDEIIKNLKILPGQYIADIGSSEVYYTFRFAKLVSE
jgi:hypothetical protein